MRRALLALLVLAVLGLGGWWFVTAPRAAAAPPELAEADAGRGEAAFWAAGCASCHSAEGAEGEALLVLAGGRRFPSTFGTFVAPNISPDPARGIGAWNDADIYRAVTQGVSPQGAHYFPVFPYTAYEKAEPQDIADLIAFLRTLPASDAPSQPHEVGFPFNIRRNVGIWKLLFAGRGWAVEGELPPEAARGRYLAEALAHCAECHTPRNAMGGLDRGRWLGGAPNPSGRGTIPNITPARLTWSEADIAEYLRSGFTPEFDTAGGLMVEVIRNTARLPDADRAALAAYLKAVPPAE